MTIVETVYLIVKPEDNTLTIYGVWAYRDHAAAVLGTFDDGAEIREVPFHYTKAEKTDGTS
jgi:hypothetical protein